MDLENDKEIEEGKTVAAPEVEQVEPEEGEGIMIPKSRFDEVNNRLKALQAEREEAVAKAKEERDAQLAEQNEYKLLYESAQQEAQKLAAQIAQQQRETLVAKVGKAAGLPEALWGRLTGEDEAALTADANALAQAVQPKAPDIDAGKKKTGGQAPLSPRQIERIAAKYGVSKEKALELYS